MPHDAPHASHHGAGLTRLNYTELLIGLDNLRRELGVENRTRHRLADIGHDGPELGL